MLWAKTYGGSREDVGRSARQTTDHGYIIAAWTESFGAGESDVYLIKTDSGGNTLWTKTYGGIEDDKAYAMECTIDEGYIITGYREFLEGSVFYKDVWLLKTDDKGDTLWTKSYSGIEGDIGRSVQQTTDGGYIIVGGGWDVFLIKTDSLGDTLWTKTYNEGVESIGVSVQQTADGGYIIAGTINLPYVIYEVYLMRTDAHGHTLWTKTYGGVNWDWDFGNSVQKTRDGGYIVVGSTRSYGAGEDDVWLLKIGSDVGVEEKDFVPAEKNYIGATIIRGPLQLPKNKYYRIFDIAGRNIATDKLRPGIYFVEIDGQIIKKVIKVR